MWVYRTVSSLLKHFQFIPHNLLLIRLVHILTRLQSNDNKPEEKQNSERNIGKERKKEWKKKEIYIKEKRKEKIIETN